MPKSSVARFTLKAVSSRREAAMASPSPTTTLSVNSSSRLFASSPDASRARVTLRAWYGWADTAWQRGSFVLSEGSHPCSSCHSRICRQVSSSTHYPTDTMSPVSSAISINAFDESRPRSGCYQLTSASTSTSLPVSKSSRLGHPLLAVFVSSVPAPRKNRGAPGAPWTGLSAAVRVPRTPSSRRVFGFQRRSSPRRGRDTCNANLPVLSAPLRPSGSFPLPTLFRARNRSLREDRARPRTAYLLGSWRRSSTTQGHVQERSRCLPKPG